MKNNNKHHSRRHRRMLTLLFVSVLVFAAIQGRQTWVKVVHPFKYELMIRQEAAKYQLDPLLVAAVVNVESKFNASAESHKGAKGLMQIMDETGKWGAKRAGIENFKPEDLFDEKTNLKLGCWYLNNLIKRYDGNVELALAAYNGGSGNVNQWLAKPEYSPDGKSLKIIPFAETEKYVEKVMKQYATYQKLYGLKDK